MGVTTDSKSDSSQHVNSTAIYRKQVAAQSNIESIHWMFRQVGAGMLLVVVAAGESENIGSVSICCLPAVFTTTTTATITYLSIHNQLTPKNAAEETRTFPSPRPKYSRCGAQSNVVIHCSGAILLLDVFKWGDDEMEWDNGDNFKMLFVTSDRRLKSYMNMNIHGASG